MFDFPIHSPLQQIHQPLLFGNEVEIWFKRDDMIHPFISGNKWRKLKYTLQKAKEENKNHLITFGGAYSNHLLATACAGALFGFKTTGWVRGEKSEILNDTLFLCKQFGMEINYIDRSTYLHKMDFYLEKYSTNQSTFFIDEGGAGENGIKGCSELVDELDQDFDYIFLASGTATTFAGIAKGCFQKNLKTKVWGVVIHKGVKELSETLEKYIPKEFNDLNYELKEYHLGGYAKTNVDFLSWCTNFSSRTGILLDPVYTGKAVCYLSTVCLQNFFPKNAKILFVHTGGLIGINGMKSKYS